MHLLFLVNRDDANPRAAGGDIMGSTYARYLAEAGHEVTYLTSSYLGASPRECRNGVKIIRLGRPELLAWRICTYFKRWGDRFDLVYEEAIGGARVPFCAPLYVKQPVLTAWYQVNRPLFLHQYGRIAGSLLGQLERWVARIHRSATILTPSESRRTDLINLGFHPEQVFAVPPVAMGDEVFQPPDAVGREPLILWLGKLRRYKCVHHAVEAMPAVIRECPEAQLVIAGRRDEAAYLRDLRRQIDRLGLRGTVDFAFDLSEKAKRDLLGRAKVLVLPSPVEGFGIVILEAAAQGTPAVVSEGVPEEVVADRYNGIRVPFADTNRLAEAVTLILQSPDLHATLSRNAMGHARTFSKPALLARLENVLHTAVAHVAPAEVAV
ncbi:MAG: glycosyltransferase family 4 protein [Dehalococcoidia bacterium]